MQLVDIGVNLANHRFDKDLAEVLERARDAGVAHMVVTGTTLSASEDAARLAVAHGLHATAGVHPHHASEWDDATSERIRELAGQSEVVAVGECGLDFNRNYSTPAEQERAFHAQLALAVELGLPVFLHERDAHDRFAAILADYLPDLPGAVLHCFTDGPEITDRYLALGLHLGITGWICDERRGGPLREAVTRIPSDRLMIETDAPYLTPRDLAPKPPGGRNEPCYLPHVLRRVAACRGEAPEHTAATTTATALRFFGIT